MSFKLKPDEEGVVNQFVRHHFQAVPMTPEKLKEVGDWAVQLIREQVLPVGLIHLPIAYTWDPITQWFEFEVDDSSLPGFSHYPKGVDVFDNRGS